LAKDRETVRSATSIPSFHSSPWIRGAPQRGLASAIRTTSARISRVTGGRPTGGRPDSLVQYRRKRRRCHRRTVAEVTITRGCLHPAQILAIKTQKRRSDRRSLGRVTVRLYTASCWRKARFSSATWRWPPQRNGKRRSRWSSVLIMGRPLSPDQSRTINRLSAGRGRVERWRARGSVRWRSHGFRRGPQSGSHGDVSSAPPKMPCIEFSPARLQARVCCHQPGPSRTGPKLKCQVHIPSGAPRFDRTFVADVPPADDRWHYQPARLRLTTTTTLAHGPFAPSGL
jgi:hypothetical protein